MIRMWRRGIRGANDGLKRACRTRCRPSDISLDGRRRGTCTEKRRYLSVVLAKFVAALGAVVEYSGALIGTAQLKRMIVHFLIATSRTLFLDSRLLHFHVAIVAGMTHELTLLAQDGWKRSGM